MMGMNGVVNKTVALRAVHGPIFTACEYVTMHGKRDFAYVIKFEDFEMERLSWIFEWNQ